MSTAPPTEDMAENKTHGREGELKPDLERKTKTIKGEEMGDPDGTRGDSHQVE